MKTKATSAEPTKCAWVTALVEVETGFEPVYAALQAATSPLGHSTMAPCHPLGVSGIFERTTGFEPATLTLAR